MNKLTGFAKGIIAGVVGSAIIFGLAIAFHSLILRERINKKELIEYAEKQSEIETLREDVSNRGADEFLEIPDVRQAADGAAAEFERKRDEALQRFRSRITY
jgi:hypothetical protein